jgi:hypothetical protein
MERNEWESAFQEAVHESDPAVAEQKIGAAETAIFNRIHDFSTGPGSVEELALFDAIGKIRVLRSVRRIRH